MRGLRSTATFVPIAGPTVLHRISGHPTCFKSAHHCLLPRCLDVVPDFTHKRLGRLPAALRLVDIEPDLILAFLDHLEQRRQTPCRVATYDWRRCGRSSSLRHGAMSRRCTSSNERWPSDEALRTAGPWLPVARRHVGGDGSAWRQLDLSARPPPAGHAIQHRSKGLEIIGVRVADVVLTGAMFTFTARAASNARHPCGRPRFRRSGLGCGTIQH
jgi:hypothetical protein